MEIILCDIFDILSNFPLPQVKRNTITINKQGVSELPHELPNELTLMILGNKEIRKISKLARIIK